MFKISELKKASSGRLVRKGSSGSASSVSIDSRSVKRGQAFIAVKGDRFDGHDFVEQALKKGAACVIVQKGFCVSLPGKASVIEVDDTVRALGDIARYHRARFDIPVIAVTGSNGKTTTKDMLAWLLSAGRKVLKNEGTQNNHIGVPMTLLKLDRSYKCAVIELGTNHFGEIAYLAGIAAPNIAIITNIGPSHLEFFKDLAGVLKEKKNVLKFLQNPNICVLNADDPILSGLNKSRSIAGKGKPFYITFGVEQPCDFKAQNILRQGDFLRFSTASCGELKLNTPGKKNIYNALAAIAVSRMLGMSYSAIARRLESFTFPGGRLTIKRVKEALVIDDTYNANPQSLTQALETLRDLGSCARRIMVMGDMLELGDQAEKFHRDAGTQAASSCDVFITVGKRSMAAAANAITAGLEKSQVFACSDLAQAKDVLLNTVTIKKDDHILLKGSRGMKLDQMLADLQANLT
ncbi:MAG: UDP-N-acetylmuramoyl-tripeptide--D-alanyl-D-alanine ligase [Candidatus Omnitrophica bacterium]|jgi:UDP-N-acetylmuramoyl-tripeptide--D-alanyl-D-alanine ligase|nr:UDP-N-acetylmuramoyl-tripeptide--D-alanyl-D-alanine ligase [Candidatus Omnitrophota bacterium]